MWSNVVIEGEGPSARCKHAVALAGHDLYLYGGRSGHSYLNDFWKLELCLGRWTKLKAKNPPPPLQEHTMIFHKEKIYMFGGEIGIEDRTPLWICNLKNLEWRRWTGETKVKSPSGSRGHIALVHSGYMLIHGGYRDLKGSLGDIWAFHFETESWHLFYRHLPPAWFNSLPAPRHAHSAIMHAGGLFMFGGMSDLEERGDFWKFDLGTQNWSQLKFKPNPGSLISPTMTKAFGSLFLFGGERNGKPTDELWRFSFDSEVWEKITFHGVKPVARYFPAVAMLPAIVRVKNTEDESAYWWDYTVTHPEIKPTNHVHALLRRMSAGNYQILGSQVDECGVDEKNFNTMGEIEDDYVQNTKRSESTVCFRAASHGCHHVQKSSSVRFAEFREMPNSTSDYSSMETLEEIRRGGFENPNYHGPTECIELDTFSQVDPGRQLEVTTPNYLLVIGGLESQKSHLITKKPVTIWRLRVGQELLA